LASNVEPASLEENSKSALVAFVGSSGPESIVTPGELLSTSVVRSAEIVSWPALSLAIACSS
jgi:hypothetical protein